MKSGLQKLLRFFGLPLRLLIVWIAFFAMLWLSRGAGGGYLAFATSVLIAGLLWWRWTRERSRRVSILHGVATLLVLAPLAYLLMPLAASSLSPLPPDAAVQLWPTGSGRALAVYHYQPTAGVAARDLALVSVRGQLAVCTKRAAGESTAWSG